MRRSLVFVFIALFAAFAVAADAPDVVVRKWLVLPAVDVAARRTLKPDAVFARYLLDRAAAPPKEGEEIVGTLGKAVKWTSVEATKSDDAKKDGFVGGDDVEIGWAYASVESATDRVAIAKLEGAGVLFVGGAGFTGDVYRLGDAGVPVALKKGANDVYVGGTRGGFRLTFHTATTALSGGKIIEPKWTIDENRDVYPDVGGPTSGDEPLLQSRRLLNLSTDFVKDGYPGPASVPLGVVSWREKPSVYAAAALWRKRAQGEPYRRTFLSSIDGSVQSYALVPPTPSDIDKSKIGLVLSLHGANVECMDQAKAYAPKPDFWIVCPTNRGRFGFDWQDWGRLDAYEVLADALKVTGVDPRRVYLTGHSMGGHGTWHLAANDPGRFLAIAPSAGWCSWETYAPQTQVMSPLAWIWRAADGASRTLDLVSNLARVPTYVLHGEKDDNVPPSEARLMIDAITKAGGHPESHFEPGVGHWWDKDEKTPGADCVDWPGIWELFRRTQPSNVELGETVSWTATDISVLNDRTIAQVVQAIDYGRPCRVTTRWTSRDLFVTTENVRELLIGARSFEFPKGARFVVDGVVFKRPEEIERRSDGKWAISRQFPTDEQQIDKSREKAPEHGGPFKRAFANRFVLVYGTAGDDAENRELLEKARYDSEVWAYRANGDANLMSDEQFLAGDFKDRNVVLYGNADTNAAWDDVFDRDCPIVAHRGVMTVNGTKHEGVVAAAFVRPRKDNFHALAAAFADTGARATRLFYSFPVFASGVGIPDYVVFGPGFLHEFDGDVRAAGWFDSAWRMK